MKEMNDKTFQHIVAFVEEFSLLLKASLGKLVPFAQKKLPGGDK